MIATISSAQSDRDKEDSNEPVRLVSPPSNARRSSPPRDELPLPRLKDVDIERLRERERQLLHTYAQDTRKPPPEEKTLTEQREELARTTKTGGAYIPPHKRAELERRDVPPTDPRSIPYQRKQWEILRKGIHGIVNKVNTANFTEIVPKLFRLNLIRGRGLFARSIMRAQAASLPFTPVYAALVAMLNTRFHKVGELLCIRLLNQFRRAYARMNKNILVPTAYFIAHLVNQQVLHELSALQILAMLLVRPTDDSVEVAVGFIRQCGQFLEEITPKGMNAIFEQFRTILHEATIDKRVQYMVEVLFQVRKDKFGEHPAVPAGLDIEDRYTHYLDLEEAEFETQEMLNVFQHDPNYEENENKYEVIRKEILGDADEDDHDEEDENEEDEGEEDEEEDEQKLIEKKTDTVVIQDRTATDLLNLRRTIYLTIMSSANFEECGHKLMKIKLRPGDEIEMANMIVECCAQERTFNKFYGLLGDRFCKIDQVWADCFQDCFKRSYETIHRFETNRLRNVAKFFANIIGADALPWSVMSIIRLTEEETTSSSRIFIKILFQELSEMLGLKDLNQRLKNPESEEWFSGLFPMDNPKHIRFSINFFTSIGLGGLTDEMREFLKNAPAMAQPAEGSSSSSEETASSSEESEGSSAESSIVEPPLPPPAHESMRSKYRRRESVSPIPALESRRPPRRHSPLPVDHRQRSPLEHRQRSPLDQRRRSPSDVRRHSPSDVRSRSDVRRRSPSDVRRRSPLDVRRPPSVTRRRSPHDARRAPVEARRRSPVEERRHSPVEKRRRSVERRHSPLEARISNSPPSSYRRRPRNPSTEPPPAPTGSIGRRDYRRTSPPKRARRVSPSRSRSRSRSRDASPPRRLRKVSVSPSPSPSRRYR